FTPAHAGGEAGDFGAVAGTVTLDGRRVDVSARASAEEIERAAPWPRLRAALQLDRTTALNVTVGLAGGEASGFLCRAGRHVDVVAARASLGPPASCLERATLEVELAGGEGLSVEAVAVHELSVVPGRGRRMSGPAVARDGGASRPAASFSGRWLTSRPRRRSRDDWPTRSSARGSRMPSAGPSRTGSTLRRAPPTTST